MKKLYLFFIVIFILVSLVFNKHASSWTVDTHMNFSEYAAESSVLDKNKGDYLKNLGFNRGLDEKFKWDGTEDYAIKWLAKGAELEDESSYWQLYTGTGRFFNHFHNPIEPWDNWDNAGLDEWMIIPIPPFLLHTTGQSSILWVQDSSNQENSPGRDWSWRKIREHYYTALTGEDFTGNKIAPDEAKRAEYFAQTFRGLGHQVHLIQDAAQPDHVRNDAHPGDSMGITTYGSIGLEKWGDKWAGEKKFFLQCLLESHDSLPADVLKECSKFNINESFNIENYFPAVALDVSHTGLVPPIQLAPIAQFIDTDQYGGSNPSTSLSQGIAEYTNANFFSDDTIFAADELSVGDSHYFPYPKKTSTNIQYFIDQNLLPETVIAEDGIVDRTFYISKVSDGETIEHFVKPIYFASDDNAVLASIVFYMDEKCHEDYAKKLMPRAVGYSAGLLNYFFRGDIDLEAQGGSGYVIVNNTEEDMDGIFEVYYDDINDERQLLWLTPGNLFLGALSRSSSFNLPASYEPKEAGRYILVFKGKLGSEDNAVVGKVAEPTGLINTSGGDSYDLAAAGTGGNVTIQADVALSPVTATDSLLVPSGTTVTLSGVQEYVDVQISGTVEATGSLTLRSSGLFILSKGGVIRVENGIDGGPLTIESEGMVLINGTIDTSGRNAQSYDIGYGGSGGEVIVQTSYPGVLRVPTIVTRGGDADEANVTSAPIDSQGGRGGDVLISSTSTNIILSGSSSPVDTLPLPPPYNICAVGSGCPAAGERLPLQKAAFSGGGSQVGFSRGILTSGGIGGAGICTSINDRDGGRGGDGGNISISSQSGVISFRDVDLITGADVEMVYSLIYLPDYAGAQNIYYAPTGSLGGKGLGACTKGGGSGGTGGNAGSISVSGILQPAPASFSSMGGPSDFGNILGFNGERPRQTDNYKWDFVIGQTIQAMDSDGSKLYRLRVDGTDRALGGSGGIPAGDATSFPGYFGLQGAGGSISGLRIQ